MPEKTLEEILGEVEDGILKFRKKLAYHRARWEEGLMMYHGVRSDPKFGQDAVTSNLVFGYVHRIIPGCYFKNPYPAVQPRGKTPRAYAKLQEVLLSHVLGMVKAEFEARKVVFDSLFKGTGIAKVGMCTREMPKVQSAPYGMTQEQLLGALGLAAEVPVEEQYPGGIERGSKEDFQHQIDANFKETVLPNFPYLVRVATEDLVPDPYATCVDDARWLSQRILMPHDEFAASGLTTRERAEGIKPTYFEHDENAVWNVDMSIPLFAGREQEERRELVELWEVWYKPTRKVYTISWYELSHGVRKPLVEKDWPYDFDEFPYEDLRFNPDPDSWFGVSDVSIWIPLVKMYNEIQNMQLTHIGRFIRRYAVGDRHYDTAMDNALKSREDGTVVIIPDCEDPSNKIVPIQDAALSGDTYALKSQVMNDLTFVTGVTHQRQGMKQPGEMTATEASLLESSAQLRDNDRLFMVTKFFEGASRKLLQILRQSISLGETMFLTQDPEIAMMWRKVAPHINRAEVDVSVRVGSSGFRTAEARLGQFMQVINTVAPWVDFSTGQPRPLLNMPEAARRLMEYSNVDDPDSLFLVPASPAATYLPERGMSGGVAEGEAVRESPGTVRPGGMGPGGTEGPE